MSHCAESHRTRLVGFHDLQGRAALQVAVRNGWCYVGHLTGTHAGGPFQGIEATGRAVALDGIDHFVVRDGVVVTNFVVFDQMQFARQLGLLPRDGSRADRAVKTAFNARTRLARRLRRS